MTNEIDRKSILTNNKAVERPQPQGKQDPQTTDESLGLMTQTGNAALVRQQRKLDRARKRGTDAAVAEVQQEFAAYATTRYQAENTLVELMENFDNQLDAVRSELVPAMGKRAPFFECASTKFAFSLPSAQPELPPGNGSNGNGSSHS